MVVRETLSPCPLCDKILNTKIIRQGDDLWMKKECQQHGIFEDLYWKGADFYNEVAGIVKRAECNSFDCVGCADHVKYSACIMVDVTKRCNLNCPICYANANDGQTKEPTAEQIVGKLPTVQTKVKPNIVLSGGEPTLRKDLPEIISAIIKKGYVPRVVTNGIKLQDDGYLAELKKSGLSWIILQFDGFSDTVYEALRGEKLSKLKLDVIEKMSKYDFKIQLSVMVAKGINDMEIGKIVKYALKHKSIFWVSFYPASVVGRNTLKQDTRIFPLEIMDILSRETDGRITKEDFLKSMKLWNLLHSITGNPVYKQKMCTFPILIYSENGNFFPINKLLHPTFLLKHFKAALKTVSSSRNLMNFERRHTPKNFLFLSIEKLCDASVLDLVQARDCHMVSMTRDDFMPFCIYNARYRDKT